MKCHILNEMDSFFFSLSFSISLHLSLCRLYVWCVHMFDCPSIYRLCQERFLSRSSPKSLLPAEESQKMYENSCYERQLRMKREKVGGGNATILVTRRSGNDHQSTCIMSSIFNLPFALAVSQGTQKNLK